MPPPRLHPSNSGVLRNLFNGSASLGYDYSASASTARPWVMSSMCFCVDKCDTHPSTTQDYANTCSDCVCENEVLTCQVCVVIVAVVYKISRSFLLEFYSTGCCFFYTVVACTVKVWELCFAPAPCAAEFPMRYRSIFICTIMILYNWPSLG